MLTWLRKVIEDPRTDRAIMLLIVLNALTLGIETSERAMAQFGTLLRLFDRVVIIIFVVEILARLIVQRSKFFKDGWNLFDACVVGIVLAPATSAFSVLRALRVLRVLRLITTVPALQRVVGGLIKALPGMSSIILLIGLIFYVSAVMAVNLYGQDYPHLFGSLGVSLYTLFTIMTLEGWVEGVVNPIMQTHPNAWLFFIPFIVFTTFTVLNLFIGIIVNAMQEEHAKAEAAEREAERRVERDFMHAETVPLMHRLTDLKQEISALREELSSSSAAVDDKPALREKRGGPR
ncbi:MAG TPA: ion transporter [Aestuariivirgaceae bacterium]|nr:ion transporter [Aestuariivirgaceae bacterium]